MPNVVVSDSNKPLWPSPRDGHACFTLAEDSSPLPQQSALRRSNSSVNISTEQAATTTTVESLPNLNTSATATASAAATASSSSAVSSSYSPPLTSTGPQILVMWGGDCNGIKSDIKLFSMNTKTWRDLPWHLDPIYKDSPQLSLQKCGPKKYFGSCMLYQQGMNRIFLFSGQDVGPPTLSGKCQLNNEVNRDLAFSIR